VASTRWRRILLLVLLVASGCSARGGPPGAAGRPSIVSTTQPILPAANFVAVDISWVSAREGWVLGGDPDGCAGQLCPVLLAHTDNGGASWARIPAPPAFVPLIEPADTSTECSAIIACVDAIRFADAQVGYVFGANSLWITSDGGRSWSEGSRDHTAALAVDGNHVVRIVDPDGFCTGGCLLGIEAAVVGSTAWHPFRVPALSAYVDVLAVNGPYLYVGGLMDGGPAAIYRSGDGGSHWSAVEDPCTPSGPTRNAVANGLTAGSGGLLLVACTTTDGSQAFAVASFDAGDRFQSPGNDPLTLANGQPRSTQIAAVAEVTGRRIAAVVRSNGAMFICTSDDAGNHWSVTPAEVAATAAPSVNVELSFHDAVHGRAFVDGTDFATVDGGAHWMAVPF
jgi:photosystem II stability/assembly factor-like uncharacterized protein